VINGEAAGDRSGFSRCLTIDHKTPCRVACISNSAQINGTAVGFAKHNIRFTCKTSGTFGSADMAKVVEAIQFKNTDAGSQPVTRTVIITYIDTNGNESESSKPSPLTSPALETE
jgi:hypothetical protein